MKKIIYSTAFVVCAAISMTACNQATTESQATEQVTEQTTTETTQTKEEKFGQEITDEGAINATEIPALLTSQDSAQVKVVGKIEECCQKKGCWLRVPIAEGQTMMVRFKDYGFFVPMDSEGKEIILEGKVKKEVIPVAQLKHYAEDAGKSKEEIDAIIEDKTEVSFEAVGVIIRG